MSVDVVQLAEHRLAFIDARVVDLQMEIESLTSEAARLEGFLATAKALAESLNASERIAPPPAPKRVTVRSGTWAAKAAMYLKARAGMAPQSLRVVVSQLAYEEGVTDNQSAEWQKLTNLISSAIWRRKEDLFKRDGELLTLRAADFELVEAVSSKNEGD